jgi:hypothetical protein
MRYSLRHAAVEVEAPDTSDWTSPPPKPNLPLFFEAEGGGGQRQAVDLYHIRGEVSVQRCKKKRDKGVEREDSLSSCIESEEKPSKYLSDVIINDLTNPNTL